MKKTVLSDDEIDDVVGTTPAPSGEPSERFIQTCLDWAKDWIRVNEMALDNSKIKANQAIIFVLSESPELESKSLSKLGTLSAPVFRPVVAEDTQGVILCTENFHQMIRIRDGFASVDEAVSLASTALSSSRTFSILSLAQRRMFVHRQGDNLTTWVNGLPAIDLRFQDTPLSADRIDDDVKTYHHANFEHPSSSIAQMLWKGKAHPYELHPSPEQRIQSYLLTHLCASYGHLDGLVDEEYRGRAGRCDLRITWPAVSGPHSYTTAMLELKVLIEGDGSKKHQRWVQSGITQADSYRQANTEAVFACIFDARKDKSDQMIAFNAVALAKDVRLRRYMMDAPLPPAGAGTPAKVKKAAASTTGKKSTKKTPKKVPKAIAKKAAKK